MSKVTIALWLVGLALVLGYAAVLLVRRTDSTFRNRAMKELLSELRRREQCLAQLRKRLNVDRGVLPEYRDSLHETWEWCVEVHSTLCFEKGEDRTLVPLFDKKTRVLSSKLIKLRK